MFLLPITSWIMIGLSVFVLAGFGYGKYESNKYDTYKANVDAEVKAQEAINKSITKQHELVNGAIKNEYETKISAVRSYYANSLQQRSATKTSPIPSAAQGIDAVPSYAVLIGQCAETTVQVNSLQDWIKQQVAIQNN